MAKADLWVVIESRRNNAERGDASKIAVPADKRGAECECRCRNPEVVFVKCKAKALLGELDFCINICGGGQDRFTRQRGEEFVRLRRQFRPALALAQSAEAKQDFTANDAANDQAVIRL